MKFRAMMTILGGLALTLLCMGAGTPTAAPQPGDIATDDLGNGVKLEMVAIPAGSFTMGSPAGEAARNTDEGPQSTVNVAAFWMGKFEVTQAQYEALMGKNPSRFKGANKPVDSVNWNDAMEFCRRLSQKTGKTYTLPTEAQWEYAARAGKNQGAYVYGNDPAPLGDNAWFSTNSAAQTHDVGGKPANAFKLCDMHGNVWEWCLTLFKDYPYRDDDGRNDPKAAGPRMLRGGSWVDSAWGLRAAYRYGCDPGLRFPSFGLRVVRSGQ